MIERMHRAQALIGCAGIGFAVFAAATFAASLIMGGA